MSKIEAKTSGKLPSQLKINLKENTSIMSLRSGKQLKPSLAKSSKVSTISKGCFMPCRMVPTCTVHGYLRDHFIIMRSVSLIHGTRITYCGDCELSHCQIGLSSYAWGLYCL